MIIDRLQKERYFTGRDTSISRYILANKEEVLSLSAHELAQKAYVSPSSVIRFAQKLGYKGYIDFQREYNYEYGLRIQKDQKITEVQKDESCADTLENIYKNSITITRDLLDEEKLRKVVRWISQYKKIDFYASNQNFLICQEYCFKLMALNIKAQAFNDIHQDYLNDISRRDTLCVLISHTGKNPTILNLAKTLKNENFKTIAITNNIDNSLEVLCDISLYTYSSSGITNRIEKLISLQFILDVLYLSIIRSKEKQ